MMQGEPVRSGRHQMITFYLILNFSFAYAALTYYYLVGATFRIHDRELSEIYRP